MFVQEVENHLKLRLIPFWKAIRDDLYGGYFGEMRHDLSIESHAHKGTIYHARILWFFSNAYKLLQDQSLLREAKHAYDFCVTKCFDQINGGVYWDVTYDGQPNDTTKHTYAQAFMIYALASYYDISQDAQAICLAEDLVKLVEEKCTDEYGYLEAFNIDFMPASNEKLSENGIEASKTMNTLLHIFEAYTELYRVKQDKQIKKYLIRILHIVKNHVYNPALKRQEVFFTRDMKSMINLHSYGHDIEAAWLIDRGLEILNDKELTREIESITQALTEHIFERAYVDHSLLNECEDGIDDTYRIWWVQAEAMIGFANGYEKKPEKTEYLQAVKDIWEYIKEFVIDQRPGGEWHWRLDENHQADKEKPVVESWKAPYHNGRMCIEIIKRQANLFDERR